MRILKMLLSIVAIMAVHSFGQTYFVNWRGLDTCKITNFRADTFRLTKTMNFSNIEHKAVMFVYDDTTVAARKNDTCVCEIGYQLGSPLFNLMGTSDTIWSNCIVLDTVNSLAASKRYNPSKYGGAPAWVFDAAVEQNVRPHGQIDTTLGTSSSGIFIPIPPQPYWAPYGRFYVKGLSGNLGAAMLKARITLIQRMAANVKQN